MNSLNINRHNFGLVIFQNKIIAFGGHGGEGVLSSAEYNH